MLSQTLLWSRPEARSSLKYTLLHHSRAGRMIVKRSSDCARCASKRDVSGDGASTLKDRLPLGYGSIFDDLSESISGTTPNDQEIATDNEFCNVQWAYPTLVLMPTYGIMNKNFC